MAIEQRYHPEEIESRWQAAWDEAQVFAAQDKPDNDKKKFVLEMFPYPSGSLHIGNLRCYIIGDVVARFLRMRGYQVMHPMGFDSLGLPAENAAIKDGIAPQIRIAENIANAKQQMRAMGLSYDWKREISTADPAYYRWNQWLFLRMLERDLVYRRSATVNWCPKDSTVLANEQVVDGVCERCSTEVLTKEIPVWSFRITKYADDLLQGLEGLNWPDRIVSSQQYWIGKSHGSEIDFQLADGSAAIKVFTTRIDTIFGATYMVIAPEHSLVKTITSDHQRSEVEAFVQRMAKVDKLDRTAENTVKEGVFTGAHAINPFTQEKIPIWIANFVLADYGTGAVMSVPAHDQRDFEFARAYQLPIRTVILENPEATLVPEQMEAATPDDGVLAAPEKMGGPALPAQAQELAARYAGNSSEDGRQALTKHASEQGFGQHTVQYHLRDWNFSRQRYWGTPIPVVHCEQCGIVPVPDKDLPVQLPAFDRINLKMTGSAPLADVPEFVETSCPSCGKPARRDVETMDTFVDSAWYFARFLSPNCQSHPVDPEVAKQWLPIDIYVGGPEHAVGHLIYFRFFNRVLQELGLSPSAEPAQRLVTQGIVYNGASKCPNGDGWLFPQDIDSDGNCAKCGGKPVATTEKMSKSKGNAVSPDDLIKTYGADTARVFLLFAGPPQKDLEWNAKGVEGSNRFLSRLWRLAHAGQARVQDVAPCSSMAGLGPEDTLVRKALHRAVAKVTSDIEGRLHYNTAIAAIMELVNHLFNANMQTDTSKLSAPVEREVFDKMLRILSPFAPHITEEMWQATGGQGLVVAQPWPEVDPEALVQEEIAYAVQVNGKLRGEVRVAADADKDAVEQAARGEDKVASHLAEGTVRKVIFVKGRLLNFVVK